MINTEVYKPGLIRTYSSIGHYIERDGVRYDEAIDPVGFERIYAETNEAIAVYDGDAFNVNDIN